MKSLKEDKGAKSDTIFKSEILKELTDRFSSFKTVSKFDDEIAESEKLVHSFSDLEETFKSLLNEHFPKLLNKNLTEEELDDLLFDVGEEFRHILYHIHTPKYYRYLQEE